MFDYLLEDPRRLRQVASTLTSVGGFMLVAGMASLLVRTAAGVVQHAAAPALATLYPSLWTWWVPETLVGTLPALFVLGTGIWLSALARRVQRVYFGR